MVNGDQNLKLIVSGLLTTRKSMKLTMSGYTSAPQPFFLGLPFQFFITCLPLPALEEGAYIISSKEGVGEMFEWGSGWIGLSNFKFK